MDPWLTTGWMRQPLDSNLFTKKDQASASPNRMVVFIIYEELECESTERGSTRPQIPKNEAKKSYS